MLNPKTATSGNQFSSMNSTKVWNNLSALFIGPSTSTVYSKPLESWTVVYNIDLVEIKKQWGKDKLPVRKPISVT